MNPEFEKDQEIKYDMRTPNANEFKIYGKYLSGKPYSVKTDNVDVKAELVNDVQTDEENKQYLTVKVSATAKDDVVSKITIYQTSDETQQVWIKANIWALPYLETIGDS